MQTGAVAAAARAARSYGPGRSRARAVQGCMGDNCIGFSARGRLRTAGSYARGRLRTARSYARGEMKR